MITVNLFCKYVQEKKFKKVWRMNHLTSAGYIYPQIRLIYPDDKKKIFHGNSVEHLFAQYKSVVIPYRTTYCTEQVQLKILLP